MHRAAALFLLSCGIIFVPRLLLANLVINEILFDPPGSDTGLEKIEIYNPGIVPLDMSGWELYPDGVGYFTFPSGFSLPAGSFAVIHLRTGGANDAANLYHSQASANMGNSSGSVAIFRPGLPGQGGRSKDTIVDFVRWHKPGSSERKTWETTTEEAGLWVKSSFVDISDLTEGQSIGLTSDGLRSGAGSWRIFPAASIGYKNSGSTENPSTTPQPSRTPSPSPAPTADSVEESIPPPTPSLGADAGADISALAGVLVQFRASAFGFDGEPLPSARFLWNFGDGVLQEGRSLNHIYHFPGIYHANLNVSSGEYAGSDWRVVTVIPPDLKISEIKSGDNGFVELANASPGAIDLGGINMIDDGKNIFRIPPGTMVGAGNVIVFANRTSGLNPVAELTLYDARSIELDEARLGEKISADFSWERDGDSFRIQQRPTPGKTAEPYRNPPIAVAVVAASASSSPSGNEDGEISQNNLAVKGEAVQVNPWPRGQDSNPAASSVNSAGITSLLGRRAFFALSLAASFVSALAFFLMKRRTA